MHSLAVFSCFFFFFNDTATTEIYTLSLHDALPISRISQTAQTYIRLGLDKLWTAFLPYCATVLADAVLAAFHRCYRFSGRSEEHTSELQSRQYLVCRLLLEKKKTTTYIKSSNIFRD